MDQDQPAAVPPGPVPRRSFGNGSWIAAFVVMLATGYFAGQWFQRWREGEPEIQTGARYAVDLRGDEPQMGPDDALVTIIAFSDFQCPYCARAAEPMHDLVEDRAPDVRVIFKHYPLPNHSKALPAAYVAWAAHQQDQFWPVHDWLFENKSEISGLPEVVKKLSLDGERLGTDMESDDAKKAVDQDFQAGGRIAIRGTPAFVVNGRVYGGSRDRSAWDVIIDAELVTARALLDDGVSRADVYATLMKDAQLSRTKAEGTDPSARDGKRAAAAGLPDPALTYRVDASDRPAKGASAPLVTIVEFADYDCRYCRDVQETLDALLAAHPEDVRLVYRQRPIDSHRNARVKSKAALAADRQGLFWPMHEALFSGRSTTVEQFREVAGEFGADVERFAADMNDPAIDGQIAADEAAATKLGARATPSFFINGRFLQGAKSLEAFEAVVAEEIAKASALVAGGVPREQVYAEVMKTALEGVKGK